jgi:transposase-like protein
MHAYNNKEKTMQINRVAEAVNIAGGVSSTARQLSVSDVTVFRWRKAGRIPKMDLAKKLSRITRIPVQDLRPTRRLRGFYG